MSDLNQEYYFAFRPDDDAYPILRADSQANLRKYQYSKLSFGAPLTFSNGFRDEVIDQGITEVIEGILNDAPFYLVNNLLRDELDRFPTRGMQLYPAIYIDNADHWHENYWFTNFYASMDVLDWDQSEFELIDGEGVAEDDYVFDRIVLDSKKLSEIPEKERMLVHVAKLGDVIIHQKIVDFVLQHNIGGVNFFKVADFVDGDQY